MVEGLLCRWCGFQEQTPRVPSSGRGTTYGGGRDEGDGGEGEGMDGKRERRESRGGERKGKRERGGEEIEEVGEEEIRRDGRRERRQVSVPKPLQLLLRCPFSLCLLEDQHWT